MEGEEVADRSPHNESVALDSEASPLENVKKSEEANDVAHPRSANFAISAGCMRCLYASAMLLLFFAMGWYLASVRCTNQTYKEAAQDKPKQQIQT